MEKVILELREIFESDQKYRQELQSMIKKFGTDSREVRELSKISKKNDSDNLKKVEKIIDKYGWLGKEDIGIDESKALFLVIQHSDDIKIQKKYFSLMKEAVDNGKADKCDLVMLEDRILVSEGKKQIYGTQVGYNSKIKKYFLEPVADFELINERRKEAGLDSIENYVSFWNIDLNAMKEK